jgi:hypothetical protein
MDVDAIIAGLSAAQKRDLEAVCRTNGGGLWIDCRVNDDGEAVPVKGPMAKLFAKGLIQGKAGGYSTVVHTREGLAVRNALIERAAK